MSKNLQAADRSLMSKATLQKDFSGINGLHSLDQQDNKTKAIIIYETTMNMTLRLI